MTGGYQMLADSAQSRRSRDDGRLYVHRKWVAGKASIQLASGDRVGSAKNSAMIWMPQLGVFGS